MMLAGYIFTDNSVPFSFWIEANNKKAPIITCINITERKLHNPWRNSRSVKVAITTVAIALKIERPPIIFVNLYIIRIKHNAPINGDRRRVQRSGIFTPKSRHAHLSMLPFFHTFLDWYSLFQNAFVSHYSSDQYSDLISSLIPFHF